MCPGLFVSVSLESYDSSKKSAVLGKTEGFSWSSSRGNVCVKSWRYNHSLGPIFANSAVTFLRWQLFLGCCQGAKHFFPFHLSPADPLETDDDYRLTESFSKAGGCCPGHVAGWFSLKASLVLTMNKCSVERRLSFICKKLVAF